MKKIIRNDFLFFYISFFFAGAQNMIAQLFFESYYPDNKAILLSFTLFCGSLMTVAGIMLSSKFLHIKNKIICGIAAFSIFSFCMLLITDKFNIFLLCFVATCFCLNFLFNSFDNFLNGNVDDLQRPFHVKMLLVFQMVAYIFSPIFFSIFIHNKVVCIIVIILLGNLAFYSSIKERGMKMDTVMKVKDKEERKEKEPLLRRQKVFIGFCTTTFIGIYIMISCLTYLFGDYIKVENHAVVSSIFMMILVVVSCFVVAFMGNNTKDMDETTLFSPKLQIVGISFLIVALCILLGNFHVPVYFYAFPAVLFGFGYGFYLCLGRRYTNCSKAGKSLVSTYNTVQNLSATVGYILSFFLGIIARKIKVSFIVLDVITVLFLFLISIFQVIIWNRTSK